MTQRIGNMGRRLSLIADEISGAAKTGTIRVTAIHNVCNFAVTRKDGMDRKLQIAGGLKC